MKKANFPFRLLAVSSSIVLASGLVSVAAEGDGGPPVVTAPAPASAPAEKLPYGVEDVLKLSRAKISEEIILNYVQNSGTIYNLGPNDIVYLRNQGVSDNVVHAMLDQRKKLTDPTAAQNQVAAQPAPASATAPNYEATDPAAQQTQPAPVYAEAPLQPPASSVYTIPYGPSYPYPYYYPYYWGAPAVTFGFGWYGGHYYGHGYYGHGHYGGHWGGGYHGGHH